MSWLRVRSFSFPPLPTRPRHRSPCRQMFKEPSCRHMRGPGLGEGDAARFPESSVLLLSSAWGYLPAPARARGLRCRCSARRDRCSNRNAGPRYRTGATAETNAWMQPAPARMLPRARSTRAQAARSEGAMASASHSRAKRPGVTGSSATGAWYRGRRTQRLEPLLPPLDAPLVVYRQHRVPVP